MEIRPNPNPYPSTDTAEMESIAVFENLIDHRFIKAIIASRDKVPNYDGTVELVDQNRIPVDKFDVQIRTIGEGQLDYDCPMSLVAYCHSSRSLTASDPSSMSSFAA